MTMIQSKLTNPNTNPQTNQTTKKSNNKITSVKSPMHRPSGDDIFIVPNEIHLLPDIAEKPIDLFLTQIVSSVEPIRAKDPHLELSRPTPLGGIQCVDKRSSIVPFKVVYNLPKLILHYVEVSTVRPVVPEIDYFESAAVVHEENRVELKRPWSWSWSWVCGFG